MEFIVKLAIIASALAVVSAEPSVTCEGYQVFSCTGMIQGAICIDKLMGNSIGTKINALSTSQDVEKKIFTDYSGMSKIARGALIAYANFRVTRRRVLYEFVTMGPLFACGADAAIAERADYRIIGGRLMACGKTWLGEDVTILPEKEAFCVSDLYQGGNLERGGQISSDLSLYYLSKNYSTTVVRSGQCSSSAFVQRGGSTEYPPSYMVATTEADGAVGTKITAEKFMTDFCKGYTPPLTDPEPVTTASTTTTTTKKAATTTATTEGTGTTAVQPDNCWGVLCEEWEKYLFAVALPIVLALILIPSLSYLIYKMCKRGRRSRGGW